MKRQIKLLVTLGVLLMGFGLPQFTVSSPMETQQAPATLKLGGLFPLTGTLSAGGVERDAAARMAVKAINADTSLLPDTVLSIVIRDTATDPTTGAAAATDVITNENVFGIVGAASSSVSKAVAEIGEANEVPVISYSSTNADLSDKTDYPYFLRVVPPDSVQGVALSDILMELGINEVATLSTNDDYGSGGISVFETAFEADGGTVVTSQQFDQAASDVLTQLQAIVDSGAKVIVLNTIVGDAKTVFSQAEDVGITPANGYQWIGTDGSTQDQVFTDESNNVDTVLRDAMQGMLGTAPNTGEGVKYEAFLDLWEDCYGSDSDEYAGCGDREPNTYATFAYDAVYAFAYAAQEMIDASGDPTDGSALLTTLASLEFAGATGPVSFDANYDRLGVYDVLNHDGTNFVDIGNWDKDNGLVLTEDVEWASGFDPNPSDGDDTPGFGFALMAFSMGVFVILKKFKK
jgi:ABC-type branched-subunit amino acid transport system substrate-binding protein